MPDLEAFGAIIKQGTRAIILTHDYPDPDCLASAWGLQYLLVEKFGISAVICFGGFIARAENRAMVELLRIETVATTDLNREQFDLWLMVDTQPGTGNSSFDPERPLDVIIDHHPLFKEGPAAYYADIRSDVGATSTIITDYLVAYNMDITPNLATGLFLGVKTDTRGLGRSASELDHQYYLHLFELADHQLLARIENPELKPGYFRTLVQAPARAKVYGPVVVSHLPDVDVPESVAEMTDLLVRLTDVNLALCTGVFRGMMSLSVRIRRPDASGDAGELARKLVAGLGTAGGHELMSGGQIDLTGRNPDEVADLIRKRLLEQMGLEKEEGRPIW